MPRYGVLLAPRWLTSEAKVRRNVFPGPNRDPLQRASNRELPQEPVSYDSAEWPIRQTNHERSGGGTCTSRCFAAQRDGHCPKRERSRDVGSVGRRLAPRGPRAAKLSGVWRPYPGTRRLLSARGKQQVCWRFGTFGPAGKMDQAALARRGDDSRILYMGDAWGLGFHPTFPADILNSLRREAYEALLIRASPIALRAYPQSKTPFLLIDLSEIHGRPIVGTSDAGNHVQLIRISVLAQDEVSTIDVVMDETIGLRTGIYERLCRVTFGVQEALIKPHLHVMLVTKRAKFLARLGSRHRSSSRTPPNELPLETAHQWNTLVPLDFGVVSQCVRSYASGVQVSRAYSLKVQKLGGLEVVESEHLCILSDGKDQVANERLVGLRDKSLAAFECLLPRSAYATSSGVNARTCQKNCLIPGRFFS